jgi:hypothetical protein
VPGRVMARREGCYRCERCDGPHVSAVKHNDGSMITIEDRPELACAILESYAASRELLSVLEAQEIACPRPARFDGRTREYRAWCERALEACWLITEMAEAGMLRFADDCSWGFAITAAGRAYLTWTNRRSS